jgi:hypothetical protein
VSRLILAVAVALLVPVAAPAASPPPARVQVSAKEFSLTLSRLKIVSGPAIVELANFGQDPHDLKLRREAKGAPTLRIRDVMPGKQASLRAKLAPGRFRLWCSIADHRERGMRATLVVAKR